MDLKGGAEPGQNWTETRNRMAHFCHSGRPQVTAGSAVAHKVGVVVGEAKTVPRHSFERGEKVLTGAWQMIKHD
jgi:hypothetical protein